MPVRDFAASLKLALSLSSTPRLLLHNKLVVLDDLQTIAYYYTKHKGRSDDVLHIAPQHAQSAPARSSPHSHPPLQRMLAQGFPAGPRAEPPWRGCRRGAAAVLCPKSPISPPLTVQALLFEEGREKEEAAPIMVLTKKDEPLVEAQPAAPIVRKLRGKIILNTGRGG